MKINYLRKRIADMS